MSLRSQAGDGASGRTVPETAQQGLMETDTIAAIGTGAGPGGIGIIRISGTRALSIAGKLFHPKHAGNDANAAPVLKARQLTYGSILDPRDGHFIDEALLAFMPSPNSYTREDVVEIQCHGGTAILNKILELVLRCGAMPAEPGQFTRRAFLNGRIDLTQAEAVADIINARSESALRLATRQLQGGLRNRIVGLIEGINELLAAIEVELEFGEEGVGGISDGGISDQDLKERGILPLRALLESYRFGRILHAGFRLAIVGRPNVGKSSLLNRLIDREKAIVTPYPGTTRDPVEATLSIEGVALEIIDTAGLRESHDPVEMIGILKSQEALESADLALFVIEAQTPPGAEDHRILNEMRAKQVIVVVNKTDLLSEGEHVALPPEYQQRAPVFVSAKCGKGIEALRQKITELWSKDASSMIDAPLCELRQKQAIESALEDLEAGTQKLMEGQALDMVAMDLRHAISQLQRVIGEGVEIDILDTIFKKFCIGK